MGIRPDRRGRVVAGGVGEQAFRGPAALQAPARPDLRTPASRVAPSHRHVAARDPGDGGSEGGPRRVAQLRLGVPARAGLVVQDDLRVPPAELARDDLTAIVMRHDRPRGPGSARNAAMKHASGEFVLF